MHRAAALHGRGVARDQLESEAGPARKAVARSASVASNTSSQVDVSLEPESLADGGGGGGSGEVEDLLDMMEQLDYKQDKSLCSARLVCRNSSKVLRRKDSSGSMLRDAGQLHNHHRRMRSQNLPN